MKYQFGVSHWATAAAALLVLAACSASAQEPRMEFVRQSDIVFSGAVVRTGGTSMKGVPTSPNLVEVEVEEVLDKPAAVSLAPGDRITVEVKRPAAFEAGLRARFYARGWILGEQVAVREVAHERLPGGAETAPTAQPGGLADRRQRLQQVRRQVADAELRERALEADMIVVGRVVSVGSGTLAAALQARRVSEHDPDWREALVRVERGIRGAERGQEVVVRFPASTDVAWFRAPKLSEGEEKTLILRRDRISGATQALVGRLTVDAYTAIQQTDVLSKDEEDRVRALLAP